MKIIMNICDAIYIARLKMGLEVDEVYRQLYLGHISINDAESIMNEYGLLASVMDAIIFHSTGFISEHVSII